MNEKKELLKEMLLDVVKKADTTVSGLRSDLGNKVNQAIRSIRERFDESEGRKVIKSRKK